MSKAPSTPKSPTASPILSLRGVTRDYQSGDTVLKVLKGVDLDLLPGQIVGLIGPSGSGKSSLLHAAGLLERPTSGTVIFDGKDVTGLWDSHRTRLRLTSVGFVYQFHHLLPEFTALDNVALPQMIGDTPPGKARERARGLLEKMGLGARLEHKPGQLSGGERQRVAIARALANRPRVLLADEPTGNLDPATSEAVFAELLSLARETGVAALIATHNLTLTRFMDRVFAIRDGHLIEQVRAA